MPRLRSALFLAFLLGFAPSSLHAQPTGPMSDFDDGTLQGWSLFEGHNGILTVQPTGGRPAGFIEADDTGPLGLLVVAPSEFTGDLSEFSGAKWDQFLFPGQPNPTISTFIQLVGGDGTTYESRRNVTTIDRWITRFASFHGPRDFALVENTGATSFRDVVKDVAMLAISMDTSPRAGIESGIDNVRLLPGTPDRRLIGPTEYRCFDTAATKAAGDCDGRGSPFNNTPFASFYLDDFEDKEINTPGVTAVADCPGYPEELGCPFASIRAFAPTGTDSVDEDDGRIDGSGQTTAGDRGHAMWAGGTIEFSFDAEALGALPTHAGIVWTDGGGTGSFEAFDALGESIGTITAIISDGVFRGTTVDDYFFGAVNLTGISKITIGTGFAVEVDHLQYGSAVAVAAGVNAATFVHDPTIGGLGSLFGSFPNVPFEQAEGIPLPPRLGPVQVEVFPVKESASMAASGRISQAGGVLAPLLFVTGNQINLQIPWEVDVTQGPVTVVATVDGVSSDPFELQLSQPAPGIFTFDFGAGRAVAFNNADGSVAQPVDSLAGTGLDSKPVTEGDVLVILATGLGPVTPDAETGEDSLDDQGGFVRRDTTFQPKVFIGGVEARVLFSGLSPEFVGVIQLNVFVPGGVEPGDAVSLVIEVDGTQSRDDVTIAVSP